MRIESVAHRVPKTRVSNEDIIGRVLEHSRKHLSADELRYIERWIWKAFGETGTRQRFIVENGETARELVRDAAIDALDQAALAPGDVDVVIYGSVARGWLEPATAAMVQSEIGAQNATCFDVNDACAGWLRGVDVAHAMIAAGKCRNALVVTCESGLLPFGTYELPNARVIAEYFATLTLGEAATATVIGANEADDFYVSFKTFPDHYDLCMLPLENAAMFSDRPHNSGVEKLKFYASSQRLLEVACDKIVETFAADERLSSYPYDVIFSHAPSERAIHTVAERLNLRGEVCFPTHGDYGNTVSSAVPLGISLACASGKLARDDKVLVVIGSAGVTVGFATFTY